VKSSKLLTEIGSRLARKDLLLRSLKIAVAAALLLLATLATLGEVSRINTDALSTWHQHLAAILFICFCLCAAYLLLRKSVDPVAEVYCPRCTVLGGHTRAPDSRTSVSPLAWHFGGFLLSIFYSGSKQERFQCRECGEFFHSHTVISRGYRLLFVLFVALIINYVWTDISELLTE
jgi:hypothetical protein